MACSAMTISKLSLEGERDEEEAVKIIVIIKKERIKRRNKKLNLEGTYSEFDCSLTYSEMFS